jgi:hypothetical protein
MNAAPSRKGDPMSKTKKAPPIVKQFTVDLTDAEVKEKGEAMAAIKRELNSVKAAKKEINADFKTKLDKLEADLTHLSGVIHAKKELRSIDCEWVRDDGRKRMVLVRTDNGQTVDERAMTDKELQVELPGTEAPERLDGRGEARAEGEPAPSTEQLPDLPQTEAAAPAPKKRGRPKKNAAPSADTDLVDAAPAPAPANGAAHDETIPF